MRKSKEEIKAEIAALEALKPVGRFAGKTRETINVQIDVLKNRGVVDDTCDEWNDLTEEQQSAAYEAQNWAKGSTNEVPSEGFGGLCE